MYFNFKLLFMIKFENLNIIKEYFTLNIIVYYNRVYVIYYEDLSIPIINTYKVVNNLKVTNPEQGVLKLNTIKRESNSYMCLTCKNFSLIRDSITPTNNDIIFKEKDYKDLIALVFKSKSINMDNNYYYTLLC